MIENLNHADRVPETLMPSDIDATALSELEAPTLFLVGEHDPVAPAPAVEIAAGLIAGAKYTMIPNSGHSAYFEQPDAFKPGGAGIPRRPHGTRQILNSMARLTSAGASKSLTPTIVAVV